MMNATGAFSLHMIRVFTAYSSPIGRLLFAYCSPPAEEHALRTQLTDDVHSN
jgi:hypothetical protein